jgi:hypothetical protein
LFPTLWLFKPSDILPALIVRVASRDDEVERLIRLRLSVSPKRLLTDRLITVEACPVTLRRANPLVAMKRADFPAIPDVLAVLSVRFGMTPDADEDERKFQEI